ncbi:MAG: RNA polymerase sigma-70 factor [Bacteroidetes bacterium]|nr:MAG: RNA polymerase sigma-70 factor [Bacteroidota bacterium]
MESEKIHHIEGLRNGDRNIFEEIFNTWYEPLCRYCIIRVGNQEEAEEIVQDIFVKLWVKREELNITTSLKSYLYRMALNKIINHQEHLKVRLSHREHEMAKSNSSDAYGSDIHQKEIQSLVAAGIEDMPPKRRKVYEYSRNEGLSYADIAKEMDISVKTVEAHLSAALEHLRKYLKDYLVPLLLLSIGWY